MGRMQTVQVLRGKFSGIRLIGSDYQAILIPENMSQFYEGLELYNTIDANSTKEKLLSFIDEFGHVPGLLRIGCLMMTTEYTNRKLIDSEVTQIVAAANEKAALFEEMDWFQYVAISFVYEIRYQIFTTSDYEQLEQAYMNNDKEAIMKIAKGSKGELFSSIFEEARKVGLGKCVVSGLPPRAVR